MATVKRNVDFDDFKPHHLLFDDDYSFEPVFQEPKGYRAPPSSLASSPTSVGIDPDKDPHKMMMQIDWARVNEHLVKITGKRAE